MTTGNDSRQPRPGLQSDILVVGGGPAGCATAIGLQRLGYRVRLLHYPRPGPTCEGLSARTLAGLRNAGLTAAASQVSAAAPRQTRWNGERGQANTEHLVLREAFDRALLEDVAAAGVDTLCGRLLRVRNEDEAGMLAEAVIGDSRSTSLRCRFLVEARGRSAPATAGERLHGPETLSLLQRYNAINAERGTLVAACEQGWLWQAVTDSGHGFIQLTLDAASTRLPKKAQLATWLRDQLAALPGAMNAAALGAPSGPVLARGSTSLLRNPFPEARTLRVGDAAMAVDPLSGNGIFQSLSSALIAPAVINTLLCKPDDRALAASFYEERVRHTFLRFARSGRDFYRLEARWNDTPFWRERRCWPDDEPAESTLAPEFLGLESKPVVDNGLITRRLVAVTSRQPLGIWHIAGLELAPLLQQLPAAAAEREELLRARIRALCGDDQQRQGLLSAWLRQHRLLPAAD